MPVQSAKTYCEYVSSTLLYLPQPELEELGNRFRIALCVFRAESREVGVWLRKGYTDLIIGIGNSQDIEWVRDFILEFCNGASRCASVGTVISEMKKLLRQQNEVLQFSDLQIVSAPTLNDAAKMVWAGSIDQAERAI